METRELERGVSHREVVEGINGKRLSGILYDRRINKNTKGSVFRVRAPMIFSGET